MCEPGAAFLPEFPIEVLLQEEQFLVVNKPAGVSVVFDRHRPQQESLWRQLSRSFGQVLVVHRLDRATTGVVLLARTPFAQKELAQQFSLHRVGKWYHAVVCGQPPWEVQTVEAPLRENAGRGGRTVVDWDRGKWARTELRLLHRLSRDHALVEASPVTGRRHQVRAHLAAVGFPILGDALYGGNKSFPRPLLHARRMRFRHPGSGQWVTVEAPYPEDMVSFLARSLARVI
ncbi:MAG: RluA family pseudouridine synthase [Thermoanaerobaculum sp.]|nr:RluA family pseudouridine synthase [Thermoanaerobaculum sp.]